MNDNDNLNRMSEDEDEDEDIVDEYPTKENFVYSRMNVPLFFVEPTRFEREWFTRNKNSLVRKYYRICRRASTLLSHAVVLPECGMTFGELAMLIISDNHARRR